MLGGSWKCNYAFYWETFLFVCLVECICFLLFRRFCLLKWDFPFVFIPTVTKNRIPRTAEVALFYLLRWSVWRLVRGIQREAQALMKLYCGHGNKPPTPEVERYRGASLHFFHPEMRQTWPRQSFWNVFQTFYNCRNTFFPLTGQVQFTLKWKLKYPGGKSTGVPCPRQHDDDWTQNQGNQVTFVIIWHWDKLLLDSPGWTWCLRCVSNPL